MSVIVEFQIRASDFELGQILTVDGDTSIELERTIPTGTASVPLFWVHHATAESFFERVQRHPDVRGASTVEVFDDRTLYRLDWDDSSDRLFSGISEHGGQLLSADGTASVWEFELRFDSHEDLSAFQDHCEATHLSLDVVRVYNPMDPDGGPWHGLSEPQFEAITLAAQKGYYEIPRGCTTAELAAELGISDQATTERLRRGIDTFVRHSLVAPEQES